MLLNPTSPSNQAIEAAASAIRRGELLLYPSDTIYGLGCDPFNPDALKRLVALKGRPEEKGFLVLIPGPGAIPKFARAVPPEARDLLEAFWPGPMTVLLEARSDLPGELVGGGSRIGLRWPDTPFLRALLTRLDGGLVSTSANRSGNRYDGTPDALRRLFECGVDLFLDAGLLPARPASTVVDLAVRPFSIVRRGELAVSVEERLRA